MASEREELVFGLRYTGQGDVARLDDDLTRVARSMRQLSDIQPAQASEGLLERISGTIRQQFSELDSVRAAMLRANIRAEELASKIAITGQSGGPSAEAKKAGGFGSVNEQLDAEAAVLQQQTRAAKALTVAYEKAQGALEQETRAHEAVSAVIRRQSLAAFDSTVRGGPLTSTAGQDALQKRVAAAVAAKARATEADARAVERQAAEDQVTGQRNLDQINQAHYKRIQAEDAIAREEQIQATRLAAVDAELAASRPQTYSNPDAATHIGQAQLGVNAAEVNLEAANNKLAAARDATTRTYESVRAAEQAQEGAAQRLAGAQNRLALLEERSGGGLGQQFVTGFKGVSDRPYAEQIGQAFKFSVLYGTAYKVLFGITQTLSDALHEGIAFQQAMTELSISSGQTADQMESLRKTLGDQATQAGFAPSQGVLIGARSLGLFGATGSQGASVAEQNRVAELSARTISRSAASSGLQPEEIQRDLAAIAQAFQQGPAGQARAFDLDAYLTRYFGQPSGSTYQAVSESATAGRAAGFSQEQVTAIAAELQARTGQDAGTIAGYMAQIFSRSGEGALLGVEQKYNVDSTTTLAEQIKELAKVYKDTPSARDEISAVFGRGKSQNASIALLQGYGDINKAATKAQTEATGAGDAIFNQRLANIGGELQILVGDLKSFSSELGRSGMLAVLGIGIKALDEFVKAATSLLQVWNQMNGVVRALIATLLVEEAVRRSGIVQASVASASRVAQTVGLTAPAVAGEEVAAGAAGASVSRAAQLKSVGEIAVVLGLLTAAGNTIGADRKLKEADASATDAVRNKYLGTSYDPANLRSQASDLQQQADQAKEAAHGIFAHIIDLGQASDHDYARARQVQAESSRLSALATYKENAAANLPTSQALIPSFGADELNTSLSSLASNGANAQDQFNALAASLTGAAGAAERASAAFDPHIFAGDNARSAYNSILNAKGAYVGVDPHQTGFAAFGSSLKDFANSLPGAPDVKRTYVNGLPDALDKTGFNQALIAQREEAALRSRGITSASDITGPAASSIARDVVGDSPQKALASLGITDASSIARLRKLMVKALRQSLLDQAKSIKDIISGKVTLSGAEQTSAVAQITNDTQGILANLPQTDHSGRTTALKRQIQVIQAAIKDSPGGSVSSTQDALNQARIALSNEQIAELEDLRKAAQQNAKNKKDIRNIGRSFLTREVNAAIRGRNTDALVTLVNTAGAYGKQIVKNALEEVLKTAQAAAAMASEFAAYASNEVAGIEGQMGRAGAAGGPTAAQQKLLDYIHNVQGIIDGTYHGNSSTDNYSSGGDANLPPGTSGAGTKKTGSPGPTAAQIAASRQSALASGSESQISQARAAIATARADMAAAKKGTTDYYSALGAYLSARNDLTAAIQSYHQNLYLLSHDATNPVVQARTELRAAAAKLKADANKPADVRAADRVAVQSAQASLESTRFSQRLDAVQTAEQLGRKSYSAYISYLDHERDRLRGIAHRSYQQQQELNQVDQLLKDAADQMQGQWNFGDIHLPTPYQVKRAIEARSGITAGGDPSRTLGNGGGATTQNTITVNGTDTAMVIRILKDALGTNVVASSGGGRHR